MTIIRPASATDLNDVQRIVEAAYAPYIARIGQPPGPMGDDRVAHHGPAFCSFA